ncbi:MAG: hypothetical protein POH28_00520 [Acidocella sp.]|nr:hypothetical protein [Acidocella sp.]
MNKAKNPEQIIIERLEHAGKTLIALRETGYRPNLAQRQHDVVRTVWEAFSWSESPMLRPAPPSSTDISLMEEAYGWILIIPESELALRRIVHARSLVHPISDREIWSWRKLSVAMNVDHRWVQRRHNEAIKIIKKGLDMWSKRI